MVPFDFHRAGIAVRPVGDWGMAKYRPKVNDIVFVDGSGFVRHVVAEVNPNKRTAIVKTVTVPITSTPDVPWSALHPLDESQNALRVVREATENK